jgi:MerR family redox-sensitive transcriptional activator SoxR
MRDLAIGDVARETGLTPSAIRFYEKAGLLPAPPRRSKQRRYDRAVFGRIRIIKLALEAGFTIAETRVFLSGFSPGTTPAARWRTLAARKLEEVNALMLRAQQMRSLLETSFNCRCPRLEDCEERMASPDCKKARTVAPKR